MFRLEYPRPNEQLYWNQTRSFAMLPVARNAATLQQEPLLPQYYNADFEWLRDRFGPEEAYSIISARINRDAAIREAQEARLRQLLGQHRPQAQYMTPYQWYLFQQQQRGAPLRQTM